MELIEILLFIVIGAAIVALVAFLLLYDTKLPWWESAYGRSIVAMKLAVLCVAVGAIARTVDCQVVANTFLFLGWAAVAVVMIWRTRMLWHDTRRINQRKMHPTSSSRFTAGDDDSTPDSE